MSLFGSMTTAISGLTAQSRSLGHISDNIANSQTVGFKRTDTSFVNLITTSTQRLHTPGAVVARPAFQNSVQGTIEQTENKTALAVAGQGFFSVAVQNGEDNNLPTFDPREFFTRAGDFSLDRNGYMVNSAGYFLEGWAIDAGGQPDRTALTPIRVSQLVSNPVSTSEIQLGANLPADFADNASFASTIGIYDALGTQRSIEFNWTKAANNSWRLDVAAPGSTLDPVGGGSPIAGFNDQAISDFNVTATVQPVRQEDVVAISAVTTGDTHTVTINGTPISYTALASDDQTTVRNQLISRINTLSSTLGVSAQVESGTEVRLRAVNVGTAYSASVNTQLTLTNAVPNTSPQYQTDSFVFTGTVGEIGDTYTIDLSAITGGGFPATRSWTYTTTGNEASINAVVSGIAAVINADPNSPAVASTSGGILSLTAKNLSPIPTWTVDPPSTANGSIPPHIGVTFGTTPTTAGTPVSLSVANVGGGSSTVPANQQVGDQAFVDVVVDYGQGQQTVRVQLGTFGQADGLTQYAGSEYAVRTLSQNGVPQGSFSGLAIRETGDVVINYDNGQSRTINRVPIVTFNAPDELERVDGQGFQRSIESGEARALDPARDGAGKLVIGSVEKSNVDIATEFTKLITAQRAYTANTRVVSASDEMLQDTLNMKR